MKKYEIRAVYTARNVTFIVRGASYTSSAQACPGKRGLAEAKQLRYHICVFLYFTAVNVSFIHKVYRSVRRATGNESRRKGRGWM